MSDYLTQTLVVRALRLSTRGLDNVILVTCLSTFILYDIYLCIDALFNLSLKSNLLCF